jgi:type 1 glutamine amidotransferase
VSLGDLASGGKGSSSGDGDADPTGGHGGAWTSSGGSGNGGDSLGGAAAGGKETVGGAAGAPSEGGGSGTDAHAGRFKILILSKALEFAHSSILDCQALLKDLGATPDANMPAGTKPGSQFTTTIANVDLSDFTDDELKNYAMLFWCNPTGPVFSSGGSNGKIGMAAVQKFVERGGAWGGVHAAADFEKTNGFPWFTNTLLGGYFDHHDADGTMGTVQVEAGFDSHPVLRGVPPTWNVQDEWYYMNRDIASLPDVKILSRLTDNRPVVWVKELGAEKAGRMFYTIRGHNSSVYKEPEFRTLVLNGILWATHRLD